jgi:hypothetical protein
MASEIDVSELRCTDQVRKGSRLGMVAEVTHDMVRIYWDGERVSTSYSREEIGRMALVLIKRTAGPLMYGDPVSNRFPRARRRRS